MIKKVTWPNERECIAGLLCDNDGALALQTKSRMVSLFPSRLTIYHQSILSLVQGIWYSGQSEAGARWIYYLACLEAQQDAPGCITIYHNSQRLLSHLGYAGPNECEKQSQELGDVA